MKKEEILKNVDTDEQRKAVEAILDFSISESDAVKTTVEEVKGMLNKQIEELKLTNAETKQAMQDQVDNVGKIVSAMQENKPTTYKSFGQIVKEKHESIKESFNQTAAASITVPVSSITKATTVIPSAITSDTYGQYLTEIGQMAHIKPVVADMFAQFPMEAGSHRTIYYTDWTTATRNAAARTVGNAAGSSVAAWTVYSATLQSISDSIPVAKEMITGAYGNFESELRNFITTNLMLKRDADLINADGNAPNIKGIYTYSSAFDSAAYTGTKAKVANLYDLIQIMATEIMKDTQYTVNKVIVNPADMLKLKLAKDVQGQYLRPFVMNGQMLDGIEVTESASQTAGTLTIGDFTKARRYYGENITLDMGYNLTGDFGKRVLTLLGNMEELLLVRTCEQDAFLKSTNITTDIANVTVAEA